MSDRREVPAMCLDSISGQTSYMNGRYKEFPDMKVVTVESSESNPVYVVGDVHGMAGQLGILLEAIRSDAASRSSSHRVIFLGDIVDRGPDSKGAMDLVAEVLQKQIGSILILGNHDEVFLDAVRGRLEARRFDHWLKKQGGEKAALSYFGEVPKDGAYLASMMLPKFEHHVHLLEAAADMVFIDEFCAVHAGIDPERPLSEQTERDVRWIREPFLNCREMFEKRIIHGHTVTDENLGAEVYRNRIAMDAGAVLGGPLCAVVIAGDRPLRFLFANDGDDPTRLRQYMEADLVVDRFQ
jgi:serine/threonine protein phosphatase 1